MPIFHTDSFTSTAAADGTIIQKHSFITTYSLGSATNAVIGLDRTSTTGTRWDYGGFMSFDTSSIPDDAEVTKVEIDLVLALAQPGGQPGITNWITRFKLGTWIGATLDATSADYNGGTQVLDVDWSDSEYCGTNLPCSVKIDLGSSALALVNKTGQTDLAMIDASLHNSGDDGQRNYELAGKAPCKLYVTYKLPGGTIPVLGAG